MPDAARRRRYPSDTSVAEWALLEPLLPIPACQTKTGGHPEKWPRRQIVDGIRYIVDNGAKWCPARGFPTLGDGLRVFLEVEPGRGRHLHP
jgi:hypothetical protein